MAKKLKSLNPIIGTGYKTLSTIKDGEDGNIENFPDTLPKIPRLSYKRLGVAGLEIGWEFEDKIYYTYEKSTYQSRKNKAINTKIHYC